ncbi:lysophospholipid acyltransferase family protein [Coraliomargarita akajimensis]|uniref:Phospholipid/glycerol acyltransferase n=1 Tax=Coraliomargarita akajimensis (strain DSM 45221 / IAM 15411 / JCM 23193 / KCTC 12865 / 04OKA010-24) TaxID=583355 RepID=D5EMR1_CORAD|nr:lysophospholipid acyltransferase family protein [Coraliomargarita akajimensis]ADE55301.1 phospholipid/glycerol acyltransferase [Coraliomargarita akajimensis DSM 45221]
MRPQIPPLYEAVRVTASWFFTTFYDFTTSNLQRVPLKGSLIFAANHISFFDPPAIGCRVMRQINYFARDTLFKGKFGEGLHAIGTIPVARDNADVKSLKAIFKSLKADGAIAIYPEGTRSVDGELKEPKAGAGMIACKSRAVVVPTRLFGTFEAYGRHRKLPLVGGHIHIAYGEPMTLEELDPGKDHPERYLEASRRIMARIASLQPPEQVIV